MYKWAFLNYTIEVLSDSVFKMMCASLHVYVKCLILSYITIYHNILYGSLFGWLDIKVVGIGDVFLAGTPVQLDFS